MELVNQTAVPASLSLMDLGGDVRGGIVTAKATYRFADGNTQLDTQDPFAMSLQAVTTDYGDLPPDEPYLVGDDRFEVILLGCAHAPEPTTEMTVSLTVGGERRELVVSGDRVWVDGMMSQAAPFTTMPLTWDRAFGGRIELEIDEGVTIEIADPINRDGRGFDADGEARRHADYLKPPAGFPRYEYTRLVPNLEHATARITRPDDRPRPACWATRPTISGLRASHMLDMLPDEMMTPAQAGSVHNMISALRSAVDEWLIAAPEPGSDIILQGLTPAGDVTFPFPPLRVSVDYSMAGRRGSLPLRATRLVLLPEEARMIIVLRAMFRVDYKPEEERSMVLRVQP